MTPVVSRHADGHTGAAFVYVDETTGNNAIIIVPGVAAGISAADVDANAALIAGAAVFVTQLEQPLEAALRGLQVARQGGARTILNPAPAIALTPDMLALCDVVTPNETEAEILTGIAVDSEDSAARAAEILLDQGVGAVVVTLGDKRALYRDRHQTVLVPAVNAGPVVETTGAGDAFNGTFAAALAEGMDPLAATRFGCAAAGLSVTRPGTAQSMPTRAEIDALLARLG